MRSRAAIENLSGTACHLPFQGRHSDGELRALEPSPKGGIRPPRCSTPSAFAFLANSIKRSYAKDVDFCS
jgi:hypothetical protein